jgi:hypothetical protein
MTAESWFDSRYGQTTFLFCTVTRPVVRPSQAANKWKLFPDTFGVKLMAVVSLKEGGCRMVSEPGQWIDEGAQ